MVGASIIIQDDGLEEVLVPVSLHGCYPMLKLTFDLWCERVPPLSCEETEEMLKGTVDEAEVEEYHEVKEMGAYQQLPTDHGDTLIEMPVMVW